MDRAGGSGQHAGNAAGLDSTLGGLVNASCLQLASSSFSGTCSPFINEDTPPGTAGPSRAPSETQRAFSNQREANGHAAVPNGLGPSPTHADGSPKDDGHPNSKAPDADGDESANPISGRLAVFKGTAAAAQVERLQANQRTSCTGGPEPDRSSSSGASRCCSRGGTSALRGIQRWWQTTLPVLAKHPSVWVLPLLVVLVCTGLGVYGVLAGSQKEIMSKKATAMATALDTAAAFQLTVDRTFTPLVSLATFIKQDPNVPRFNASFPSVSEDLLTQLPPGTIQELQMSPFGIIRNIYPANAARLGIDIFQQQVLRPGAMSTIAQRALVLSGPLQLVAGNFAGVARIPIFIALPPSQANESWGNPIPAPTNCGPPCEYDPVTGTKFWGFFTAIIGFDALLNVQDSRLSKLTSNGYHYTMTRPDVNNTEFVITSSPLGQALNDPVSVQFEITRNVWTLYVEPANGWAPPWCWPVVAAVVVLSLMFGLMCFFMLLSHWRQQELLDETVEANRLLAETTRSLEEEKVRMDALLVRQYNLIACFGKDGQSTLLGGGAAGSFSTSKTEGISIERIESMRRQLNTSTAAQATHALDDIQCMEMLGEGTFGKVYKGLWRGTVVAVKTMILPANMSGAEKREKMAVMEAAISSSLAHPNIVTTYTYSIKPVTEQAKQQQMRDTMETLHTQGGTLAPASSGPSQSAVHSYEVRLVLEYCDKGCLRDALDAGSFFGPEGINYPAILDTAADIAKAMLHLHSAQVLHSDLKARNVMLMSSGTEGRGVMAKVADFGLSLKMDHMETHISSVFQGTMTHMAPEILLEGRISKAADVYAFGITLWELFTGGRPFEGTPRALLGSMITREGRRPAFPTFTPANYRSLCERCWHQSLEVRPSFEEILAELLQMRATMQGPTQVVVISVPAAKEEEEEGTGNVNANMEGSGINLNATARSRVGRGGRGGNSVSFQAGNSAIIVGGGTEFGSDLIPGVGLNAQLPTLHEGQEHENTTLSTSELQQHLTAEPVGAWGQEQQ